MADVRALLRQQRQSRRIEHPHAAYSDAGKLLCTLCRKQMRAETQWESHTRSTGHQQRAIAATTIVNAAAAPSEATGPVTEKAQVPQGHDTSAAVEGPEEEEEEQDQEEEAMDQGQTLKASDGTESQTQAHKRKISDDDYQDADAMDLDEAIRRKRSRGNISIDVSAANHRQGSGTDKDKDSADVVAAAAAAAAASTPARRDAANRTPPTLARRMSSTPSRGVELQIPSRPATPAAQRDSSSSSTTPGLATLAGLSAAMAAHAGATPSSAGAATTTTNGSVIATEKLSGGHVDEDEWAAFEAEMAATAAPYADDAVISAPAMNAEEAAAAAAAAGTNGEDAGGGGGGGSGSRKSRADLDIEGEREDAARAREDEMSDMQELEARVRRLKEKREELRQRASSIGQENNGPARLQSQVPDGDGDSPALENGGAKDIAEEDDEDEDNEDDDEDDWDGFRFRR